MKGFTTTVILLVIFSAVAVTLLVLATSYGPSIDNIVAGIFGRPLDYDLSINPTAVNLSQRNNSFALIHVTFKGKPQNVTIDASNLPSGVNAFIGPKSVKDRPNSVLLFTSSENATLGSYEVTVTITPGEGATVAPKSSKITLNIKPNPIPLVTSGEFSISVQPASGNVVQGDSVSTVVSEQDLTIYHGFFTFSCQNLNLVYSCSVDTPSCYYNQTKICSSKVTIITNSSAGGTYFVPITGVGSSKEGVTLVHSVNYSLTMGPVLPPQVTIISPAQINYVKTDVPMSYSISLSPNNPSPISSMSYSLDGSALYPMPSDFKLILSGRPSSHALTIFATDANGNTGSSSVTFGSCIGDVNQDGKIDISDIATVGGTFGSQVGDSNYNPKADLNDDGKIDILDITLVSANFGQTCPLMGTIYGSG